MSSKPQGCEAKPKVGDKNRLLSPFGTTEFQLLDSSLCDDQNYVDCPTELENWQG